jgi:hypothetical protein
VTADREAEATGRWRAAEARLYPVVMVRPDLYERSVTAVHATVEKLQGMTTIEDLMAAEGRGETLVAEAMRDGNLNAQELDLPLIAGAAFGMRHAQIEATLARARSVDLISNARARGETWVLLSETDRRAPGAVPDPPYHCLEIRLADGLGLHLFVDPDPSTARPVYGLETVQLDRLTGEWLGDARPPTSATYSSPEPWDAHARALRN